MAASVVDEILIRPYQEGDRDAVYRIAADTALFGDPVEGFLEDRRLFCSAVYRYYLDYEPEHAWIATAGPEVAGFLAGCVDTRRHDQVVAQRILPRVALAVVGGRYRLGRRTLRYLLATAAGTLRGEFPHVDLSTYPAHLHINLAAPWRGRGAGRRLMEAYLAQLRRLGVPGVHLRTSSLNRAALALYERTGFRVVASRPTRLWSGIVAGPVENLCLGRSLDER